MPGLENFGWAASHHLRYESFPHEPRQPAPKNPNPKFSTPERKGTHENFRAPISRDHDYRHPRIQMGTHFKGTIGVHQKRPAALLLRRAIRSSQMA